MRTRRGPISRSSSGNRTVSHDPKLIHSKAAQKILEYLNATSDLGLTFRRDSDLGSAQMEFCLETYVDADYDHKAEDRCSVSGLTVCWGVL